MVGWSDSVQTGTSPLHCRSPWQRLIVTSRPLGSVNPGLQRTSSRASKELVGWRRLTSEFSLGGRGQGQVRPGTTQLSPHWPSHRHCLLFPQSLSVLHGRGHDFLFSSTRSLGAHDPVVTPYTHTITPSL